MGNPEQEKTLGMTCHLLGLVGFLGPLIIWLIKKDVSPAVDENGKEALNFQLSILIYMIASWLLIFVGIGFILMPLVWLSNVIMVIIASVKTNQGETFKDPLCIRLIK